MFSFFVNSSTTVSFRELLGPFDENYCKLLACTQCIVRKLFIYFYGFQTREEQFGILTRRLNPEQQCSLSLQFSINSQGKRNLGSNEERGRMTRVCTNAMERNMLRLALLDRVGNKELGRRSGAKENIFEMKTNTSRLAGHVVLPQYNRWTNKLTWSYSRSFERLVGGLQ